MNSKNILKIILCVMFMFFASRVFAAYTCSGKIDLINQPYEGSVSIVSSELYGNTSGRTICNLVSVWKGVSPETCKGWLSKLLSHEARGKDITVQYNDALASCASQPTWSSASNPWSIW